MEAFLVTRELPEPQGHVHIVTKALLSSSYRYRALISSFYRHQGCRTWVQSSDILRTQPDRAGSWVWPWYNQGAYQGFIPSSNAHSSNHETQHSSRAIFNHSPMTPAMVVTILGVLSSQKHYLNISYEDEVFIATRIHSGAFLTMVGSLTERFTHFQTSVWS